MNVQRKISSSGSVALLELLEHLSLGRGDIVGAETCIDADGKKYVKLTPVEVQLAGEEAKDAGK